MLPYWEESKQRRKVPFIFDNTCADNCRGRGALQVRNCGIIGIYKREVRASLESYDWSSKFNSPSKRAVSMVPMDQMTRKTLLIAIDTIKGTVQQARSTMRYQNLLLAVLA